MTALATRATAAPVLPALLAGGTVLAEVAYPLVDGRAADVLTVLTVLLFAAASVGHCAATRGTRAGVRLLVAAAGVGFVAEAVGVHTGLPFGDYAYAGSLGPRLLAVPLVVPLAWVMMSWPTLVVVRLLAPGPRAVAARALLGGVALAGWDLFLDPQMVDAGHWSWSGGAALNGIPLTNTLGWLLVGTLLTALVDAVLPAGPDPGTHPRTDAVPLALWGWTYAGSVLANLAFFGRPGVALAGGLAMGAVAAPLARRLLT